MFLLRSGAKQIKNKIQWDEIVEAFSDNSHLSEKPKEVSKKMAKQKKNQALE